MRKKALCTVLAAFLLLGRGVSVQAEDYTGGDWRVEFTGTQMASNFSSSDIAEAVYALQPGDSVTISLNLENTGSVSSEWYMTNRVLSSLEDSSEKARGGAYTYRLAYTGGDGEVSVLFDSMSIGGEKSRPTGLGLHEVEGTDEYFRLDTLDSGEKGMVTLTVALDGETQGNAYQNTLADLQLSFAVDTLDLTSDQGNDNKDNQDHNGNKDNQDNNGNGSYFYSGGGVKTGDESKLALWSAVAFVSGAALLVMALVEIKKGRKEEEA